MSQKPATEGAIIEYGHLVAAGPEEIVDRRMHREKPLRLTREFETAHLAFLLANRLMRDFRLMGLVKSALQMAG